MTELVFVASAVTLIGPGCSSGCGSNVTFPSVGLASSGGSPLDDEDAPGSPLEASVVVMGAPVGSVGAPVRVSGRELLPEPPLPELLSVGGHTCASGSQKGGSSPRLGGGQAASRRTIHAERRDVGAESPGTRQV